MTEEVRSIEDETNRESMEDNVQLLTTTTILEEK